MARDYIESKTFENVDFSETPLHQADYELCTFLRSELPEALLNNLAFIDCKFIGCNLINAQVDSAGFR